MASNDVHEFSQRNPIQLKRQAAFCVDAYEKRPRLGALQETQIVPSAIFDCLPDEFPSKIREPLHVKECRRQLIGQKNHQELIPLVRIRSPDRELSDGTMDDATQPATQPYQDPRRLGRNNSGLADEELADVLCILHPTSEAACEAVKYVAEVAPQHVAPNNDLIGDDYDSFELQDSGSVSRDIALRFSSDLKNQEMGFVFGRSAKFCDIPLVRNDNEKQLSNQHFRVFLNPSGTLMLQDTSTNGTFVDGLRLLCKKGSRVHHQAQNGDTRMLTQGGYVSVVGGKKNEEIKFMIRLPRRGEYNQAYLDNAERWIALVNGQKSKLTALSTVSENLYGMHWNGGEDYNVTGNLGKGAFATVYKIATKRDGVVFAAKELDKRRFMKNGILDLKVENEMKIMQSLRHPNIVQYVGHHEYDQWVYIIMEFIPGGELSSHISKFGPLSETDGQIVTRQVLHALDYLHKRKITHRDIKPDNLLIASTNPLVVKLSDFGLSKCVNDQDTFLKTFCGTLLYCAPEVYPEYGTYLLTEAKKRRRPQIVHRTSPYDQSVDMWSFGAVLFHILSGKPPIMGRGDDKGAQMLNNIMTKPINHEPLTQRGISREGILFIVKLLKRDPTKRPKEKDCFNDPWLADMADIIDYEDDEEDPMTFDDQLQAIPGHPIQTIAEESSQPDEDGGDRLDPRYHSKRQRVDSPMTTPDVTYPDLPLTTPEPEMAGNNGRLFGEISRTNFPSSGLFGKQSSKPDLRSVTRGVENVSVNDFVTFNFEDIPQSETNLLTATNQLQIPPFPGSAPSLMGAEAQLGHFQMASPCAQSDGTSPSTTNPQTPKTREMTPSGSNDLVQSRDLISDEHLAPTEVNLDDEMEGITTQPQLLPKKRLTRSVDLPNPEGIDAGSAMPTPPYLANYGAKPPLRKAATFQIHQELADKESEGLAKTVDAQIRKELANDIGHNPPRAQQWPANGIPHRIDLPEPTQTASDPGERGKFVKPAPRLGRLQSITGSFANVVINLNNRMTSWGRASTNSVVYPDATDTRIPKCGLQITFWAPGIEEKIDNGADWMRVSGIRTVVSTQASSQIWVNGVKLRRESTEEGEAGYLFGKIYTGDIITIRDGPQGQFLKFHVEISYGDSARYRPPEEPFKIRKESKVYSRGKSMTNGNGENGTSTSERE